MKVITILAVSLFSLPALAFESGTYRCKHSDKTLPDNVYRFENVTVADGATVPYVEATRYFRNDADSPVREATIKGFALVSKVDNSELVKLGTFQFQFIDGQLANCKR